MRGVALYAFLAVTAARLFVWPERYFLAEWIRHRLERPQLAPIQTFPDRLAAWRRLRPRRSHVRNR